MPQPSERDALLGSGPASPDRSRRSHPRSNDRGQHEILQEVKARPGPLDISKHNRYAILAGIWTATFLSVSVFRFLESKCIVAQIQLPQSLNSMSYQHM